MTLAVTKDPTSVPQHPVGPKAPNAHPWKPVEIVYSQLKMRDPSDPSTAYMSPQNLVIAIDSGQSDPVGDLIRRRQSDPFAPVEHSGVYSNDDPAKGACDVFVDNQCHVVIEIDPALAWGFCASLPCITLKADTYRDGDDHHNFGLQLHETGKFASFSVAIRPAAEAAGGFHKESFNIVVQKQGAGAPEVWVIDPDSTNQNNIPPAGPS